MDTSLEIRYAVGHETPWNARTVGASQTNSPRIVAHRPDLPGCGATREGVREFRGPVAAGVSEERVERHPASVKVGAPSSPISPAARRGTVAIGARSHRRWVLHQPVDVEANRPPDRETPRSPLHPRWGVEVSAHAVEVELPEAGTPGLATGRRGHRALEAERLAPDKKNSAHLGPISGSSTKAGFCSFPTSVGPGPRWDGLPSTRIVTAVTSSRSLGASRSHPPAHDWDCTSASTPTTSPGLKPSGFCDICCAICGGRWSWSGIGGKSISGKTSRPSCAGTKEGSMSIRFPRMPLSLIPRNRFGPMASETYPTAPMNTWAHCDRTCAVRSADSRIPSNCSGRASSILNYPGLNSYVSIIS